MIRRSKTLVYADDPEAFALDIAALTSVKRRMLVEDFVID